MRLVGSAKSWLCHPGVDRQSAILPWQAPSDVARVSPLEASARYLQHIREAWDHQFPDTTMTSQEVVLTVPASFDASARDLTLKAAQQAGVPHPTLIEEPQAALYAWCEAMGDGFRKHVRAGEVILVVDVGGGTTDFLSSRSRTTKVKLDSPGWRWVITSCSAATTWTWRGVHASASVREEGKKLDSVQMIQSTFACRQAKEQCFRSDA